MNFIFLGAVIKGVETWGNMTTTPKGMLSFVITFDHNDPEKPGWLASYRWHSVGAMSRMNSLGYAPTFAKAVKLCKDKLKENESPSHMN